MSEGALFRLKTRLQSLLSYDELGDIQVRRNHRFPVESYRAGKPFESLVPEKP